MSSLKEYNEKMCITCPDLRAELNDKTKYHTGMLFCVHWNAYKSWWNTCGLWYDKRSVKRPKKDEEL